MPSNLERKSQRKRQTRLTFDPVDLSSSPSTMSPAKVRYQLDGAKRTPASSGQGSADAFESDNVPHSSNKDDFSPAPRKKTGKLPFKPLPTPAKSSQPQAQADDSSDSLEIEGGPKPSTFRQTRSVAKFMPTFESKKKQRSLGYDGGYDSSEGSEVEDITPTKNKSSTKKKTTVVNLVSESDDALPVTPKRKPVKKGPFSSSRATRSSDSNGKSRRQKSVTLSDSDDDELVPLSKIGSARKALPHTPVLPRLRTSRKKVVDDSSEDDPIISSPKRSQRPTYQVEQDDEDEEDEDIQPSPIKRYRRPVVEDDVDEEPVISPLKRPRPTVESTASPDDDISPTKRRRQGNQRNVDSKRGEPSSSHRSSRGRSSNSESTTPQRITRQQNTKRKHRTAKEKQMELLKRRRNGDNSELTDSESESESDGEEEFQQLEEFDDEEIEEAPVRPSRRPRANQTGDAADSDNFITDDEDGDIGVPGLSAIPLEFTHHAHKQLKDHFKDAVEWMVHNKINPAFARDDPIYRQAFKKLNDECSGLAKSKFASSQWTKEFTRAVYARPLLEEHVLIPGEGFDMASGLPICHACNHRKHKPSVALIFNGKAYDKVTLEEIDQGSSDSDKSKSAQDSEDSDDPQAADDKCTSVNSQDQDIPPATRRYAVGPVCKTNAQQTHTLVHWKYNLNQWVISALEAEGELTPAKLAERDDMNAKKRTKYTNGVVDRWEEMNQIKQLWHDYKLVTSTAREMKEKGRGGWQ
ncbi:uncharacterized protein LY89DRAFT_714896 [Mollisia scopiformis]|uniref:DUF4211 domain-containing protein n=1 Tax=Mollisia scopiformis TaxID=149040 RepID=A0A194XP58_MOLSC|nr:uncharacterized protein LY89DRAFT_714896 [Mollisia scopiformis]KUJ21864.1 hypothetical protein LY89DRAFT_714896 [Mollisia scopiformis]